MLQAVHMQIVLLLLLDVGIWNAKGTAVPPSPCPTEKEKGRAVWALQLGLY